MEAVRYGAILLLQNLPEEKSIDTEISRVIYEDDKMKIEFASGSKTALVNGVETDLAGTAIIKDGRFMVPAGLVGQLVQHYAVQDETNVVIFVF